MSYNCEALVPVYALVGRAVQLHVQGDGVRVIYGSKTIGAVIPDEAVEVSRVIQSETHCPGFALGVVADACEGSSDFAVHIVDHREEDE